MSTLLTINGVEVDIEDPCAVLTELRKAELLVATGGAVRVSRFGQDEIQFTEAGDARLQRLIGLYEGRCEKASGRRRRFAKRVVWDR